ncbi:MAG: cryptochrome/photolyase family protein [Deltaproteobacteria bacterium]|nr:cryptochrome/photolyase family protein [Deltaproteobacteria bacterium]
MIIVYGGKWSFDVENRRRLPAELQLPSLLTVPPNKYTEQALKDINEQFSKNPRLYRRVRVSCHPPGRSSMPSAVS